MYQVPGKTTKTEVDRLGEYRGFIYLEHLVGAAKVKVRINQVILCALYAEGSHDLHTEGTLTV